MYLKAIFLSIKHTVIMYTNYDFKSFLTFLHNSFSTKLENMQHLPASTTTFL